MATVAFEDELTEAKKLRKKMNAAMDEVTEIIDAKSQPKMKEATVDPCIERVARYSAMMKDESALGTMSPQSKESHLSTLATARKQPLQKLNSTSLTVSAPCECAHVNCTPCHVALDVPCHRRQA